MSAKPENAKIRRLEPRDWERAALDAIAEDGVSGVSIPKLARRLGVTKGSFYWHFTGLDALFAAALARWERSYTDRRIAAFEATPSAPADRFKTWWSEAESDHEAQALYLEISNAATTRADFAQTVARVVEKRTAFLARTYFDQGFTRRAARKRAVIAYAGYLGLLHLARIAPDTIGSDRARAAVVRHAMELIGAPEPGGGRRRRSRTKPPTRSRK